MARLLLLIPATSYRVGDFVAAAHRLGVDVTIGSNERQVLAALSEDATLTIDFADPETAMREISEFNRTFPLTAVVAVDGVTGVIAALAAKKLGLRHNDPAAIRATGNKLLMREALLKSDLPSPNHRRFALADDPNASAPDIAYPCVLKPLNLSASQGVIRANNPAEFITAWARLKTLLEKIDDQSDHTILVEDYIAGEEVALEGLMVAGKLTTLAIFDKPDPLDGPYFEETIYVTPSRQAPDVQASIRNMAEQAANALGLHEGPLHAELRVRPNTRASNEAGPWVIELAARSIGGLCSRSLQFSGGLSLEDIILRHAMGEPVLPDREATASGVMMIPIPKAGILERVDGTLDAQAVRGITEVTISIALGQEVIPLPEGHKYLGFIFAKAETPAEVEAALRAAHGKLSLVINAPPP